MSPKPRPPLQPMLRIHEPGRPDRLEDLLRERYAIGRGGDETPVDFALESDPFVSRLHALLVKEGSGYRLENQSANGTEVNGKRLEGPRTLERGDRIRLGERSELEYLLLTPGERSRQLEALATGRKRGAAAGKSLWRQPWFVGMTGLYAAIGLMVLVLGGKGAAAPAARNPGPGPYFGWMREHPLVPGQVQDGAREVALRMWQQDQTDFGGAGDGNEYLRLLRAREALRVLGYASVAEAAAAGEQIAKDMEPLLQALETRVAALYQRCKAAFEAGQFEQAATAFEEMIEAVPGAEDPVRLFALQGLAAARAKAPGRASDDGRPDFSRR